jgi:hypothetical protein
MHLPGRNVRQCRDRWFHYLADLPSRCRWSINEDILLRRVMRRFGGSPKQVMAFFPDRTLQEVRWRWNFIKSRNANSGARAQQTVPAQEVADARGANREGEQENLDVDLVEAAADEMGEGWWHPREWDEEGPQSEF